MRSWMKGCSGDVPSPIRRTQFDATGAGFSLLEMLVSIAIIVLLMSAVFPFLFQAQKRFQANVVTSEANQGARAGLEVMAQEIGQAGYNPQFTQNKTSSTSVTACGSPQYIGISDLNGINPGDYLSVDTGPTQELVQVLAITNPPTTPATSSCLTNASAPGGNWIQAKFEYNHATTPYIISSYKIPYASGILVTYDSALPPNQIMTPPCTQAPTTVPPTCSESNDRRLEFYGDINQNGEIDYVVYSINTSVAPTTSVTINGATYGLYDLYRSITPVQFPSIGIIPTPPPLPTSNNPASPMVEKVIYDATNRRGPTGQPIFAFPSHQQIGTYPNVYTALGTVVITLCVAVNPQAMESSGQVQWYTMATQIRPLNLASAINVNNNYGGVYIPPTPLSLPMANPSNYYP